MDALPPSVPPAIYANAPDCRILTPEQAGEAYQRLVASLPGTAFDGFRPSEVCGLVQVRLRRGTVAYTDATGRFFLLALALDTHKGSPADADAASDESLSNKIDALIDARTLNPQQAAPGAMLSPDPLFSQE